MNHPSFRVNPLRYQFRELPPVPADLAAMSPEDLAALESGLVAYFAEVRAESATPTAEVVTELQAVVGHVTTVRAELARRASPDFAAQLADLDTALATAVAPATEAAVVEPELDADGNPIPAALQIVEATPFDVEGLGRAIATGLVEARAVAVTAGGQAMEVNDPSRISLVEYRPREAAPMITREGVEVPATTLTASSDIPGMPAGQQLVGFDDVVKAFDARANSMNLSLQADYDNRYDGAASPMSRLGDRVPVVRVESHYPEDRLVTKGKGNLLRQVEHVTDPDAIAASGGLCAPVAPFYTQLVIAEDLRPVAAALPTFGAERGGLRWVPPPNLASLIAESPDPNPYFLGNAVGTETVAEDANGGTKLCLDVPCNDIAEVDIEIIWRCLQFANVTSRTFPEQVEAFVRLVNAAWAQAAEELLLTNIANFCLPVTDAKTFGTARQVVAQLGRAAAYLRNTNRTDPKLTVRVLLPAWVRDAMRVDLGYTFAGSLDFFSVADAQIDSWFAEYGVVASYYIDTASGADQTFVMATSGEQLPSFPATIAAYIFFEGHFLHLDAGILDLGIIRDSTLTALNKFRNFGESFENVVYIGPPGAALAMTMTTCPDGGLAASYAIATQDCVSDDQ
jgi:hypothetical protein